MAAFVATSILLVGCSDGAMDIASPAPTGAAVTVCGALVRSAPETVAGQGAREVSSDGVVLAWGVPPIVVRCGVSDAIGLTPSAPCYPVNGVGWYSEDLDEAYRFTTIGRQVPIEVTVPDEYAPQGAALVDLASAVKDADPVVRRCV